MSVKTQKLAAANVHFKAAKKSLRSAITELSESGLVAEPVTDEIEGMIRDLSCANKLITEQIALRSDGGSDIQNN